MLKPESILENETHSIFRDFEIQTDCLILDRKPDLVAVKKKEPTVYWSPPSHQTSE